jgi:hypothetical protein
MRAYTASKLCNLLTARSLADTAHVRDHGITVLAYLRVHRRHQPRRPEHRSAAVHDVGKIMAL